MKKLLSLLLSLALILTLAACGNTPDAPVIPTDDITDASSTTPVSDRGDSGDSTATESVVTETVTQTVTDAFSVVNHIIMGQHNTLGEAGGAGGILHVADIVRLDIGCHAVDFFDGHFIAASHGFIKGQAAGLSEIHRNHIAQERQTLAVQRLAGLCLCNFGTDLIDDIFIVGVQR